MAEVKLFGPHWSAYTRTVRLVLTEKAVEYELVEIDFASGEMPREQKERHPFSKVPVLDHDGFAIYETSAICRYIDAAFKDVPLQPSSPQALGRMAQIISILDAYLSHAIRMGYFTEVTLKPLLGLNSDPSRIDDASRTIEKGLEALAECCHVEGPFLTGSDLSLADLHAAPLFDLLEKTPEGSEMFMRHEVLRNWWFLFAERDSLKATHIDISVFQQPE